MAVGGGVDGCLSVSGVNDDCWWFVVWPSVVGLMAVGGVDDGLWLWFDGIRW